MSALTNRNNFTIVPCEPADAEHMAICMFDAFVDVDHPQARFYGAMFPRTTSLHEFFKKSFAKQIEDQKHELIYKVTDQSNNDAFVGFVKWKSPRSGDSYWADWAKESNVPLCEAFFTAMGEARTELMGDRPHYFLELLGVSSKYARKGVGALLLDIGLKKADAEGLEGYVDSSPLAAPLYERHGFVLRKETVMPAPFDWYTERFMVRPVKGTSI